MRMLAEAFQVLGAENGDILEHLTDALGRPAVDLPVYHIIKVVVLEPVAAEALGGGADGPAVQAVLVPPVDIESILAGTSHILLVFFKFSFGHHFAAICIANDTIWKMIRKGMGDYAWYSR